MASSDDLLGKFQAGSKKAASRIAERDEAHLDPSERANLFANYIFKALELEDPKSVIEQPLWGDIMGFAIEMINSWALQMDDDGLTRLAKNLSRTFYTLHYSYPEDHPALGPSREEHTQLWIDRMEKIKWRS